MRFVAMLLLVIPLAGCAAVLSEGKDTVWFVSYPEGAQVKVDGKDAGVTPCSARVWRGWGGGDIEFDLAGHEPMKATAKMYFDCAFLINLFLPPGFVIDLMLGTMREPYPLVAVDFTKRKVHVPTGASMERVRLDYENENGNTAGY